jgi:very-short-patch-repair endonuclease
MREELANLHRIHRGVYAVGHRALSSEGRWIAAVLACGPGAVLSHRSAAALWEIAPIPTGQVEVTVPTRAGRRSRRGISVYRSSTLGAGDVTRHRNIPVTTPARTIFDLQRIASEREVRRALREAGVRGLPIGDQVQHDGTRSELERSFLRLCHRHRLPLPEVNVKVGPFTVDFLWRDRRLIVETDGWQSHRGRGAFEDDRARDVELRPLGYEIVRFTYRQVIWEPARVADLLRRLLAR